jgi:outer membrane protein
LSEAKIEQSRATDNRQQLRDRVAFEVKEAVLKLQEATQRIHVAGRAIAQAEENFRISGECYVAQIATSTEVVDAEALLTQARTNYFYVLYEHLLAAFALQKATGVILE